MNLALKGLFEGNVNCKMVNGASNIFTRILAILSIFFILQAPYNDPAACAGFIGVKTSTSKAHMLRAVIEGCAFM